MVYTTFAIIATSLLLLLFVFTSTTSGDYTSDENPFRIGEASYYLQNIEGDLSRAHQIAARRAGSSAVNYTVREGEAIDDLEETLVNITLNGSTENFDTVVENSSLNSWKSRVKAAAEESRYELDIKFREISFNDSYLDLVTTLNASTELYDPTTSVRFNHSPTQRNEISFTGYEDTMLLLRSEDKYINTYKACGFEKPAEQISTGTSSNTGATYGEATRDTSADNKSRKILITETEPTAAEANQYAGIVSTQNTDPGYNDTKYIFGAEIGSIENRENIILYENQVWNSKIRQIIETGCYMNSQGTEPGPGVMERMKNQLNPAPGENQGLVTLIDKTRMPPQIQYIERSNIGYLYFQGEQGQGIAGLTGQEAYGTRDYRTGFRLNTEHITKWNLTGLTY
jgi:hypothetical protein